MVLGGDDAIAQWRRLMGPTDSVRAREEAKDRQVRNIFYSIRIFIEF